MKTENHETLLPLLGGLGNQLFQLSAALHCHPDRDIRLISDLGFQRRNPRGRPDIESFNLPKNVIQSDDHAKHRVCTKAFNLLLKSGLQEHRFDVTTQPARLLAKIILCLHTRKFLRFHISKGVGFSEWSSIKGNQLAIGYFQSHIWTMDEKVRKELAKLTLLEPSARFLELEKHFSSSRFTAIHVRLTDYESEPNIGTLDSTYFQKVLTNLSVSEGSEIWLFSDDPQRALEMMPPKIKLKCKTFAESEVSANEEWQLMRYATEFYISNSTYSWWAARLAFNSLAKVFVPKPWFAIGPQPNQLIPPEWIEVGRFE